MGLWDGVPYELQSPTWRNAMNQADGTASGSWDPTLNLSYAEKFLTWKNTGSTTTSSTTVSSNAEQQAEAEKFNALEFLTQVLLTKNDSGSSGGSSTPQQVTVQQTGLDPMMILIIGGVAAAAVWLTSK